MSIIDEGGATEDGLISDARLTANFGTAAVTGTLSNFSSDSHGALSGTLAMTVGIIAGPAYNSASINGVLTDTPTGDTLTVGAASSGAFFGQNGQLNLGDLSGTATWSNLGVGQTIEGFIVAQDRSRSDSSGVVPLVAWRTNAGSIWRETSPWFS